MAPLETEGSGHSREVAVDKKATVSRGLDCIYLLIIMKSSVSASVDELKIFVHKFNKPV